MLEDIALLRAVKRAGGSGTVVDGTALATCRMYDGWPALREGYTKSLWSAFGSPAGAVGVVGALGLTYVLPPLAALRGSRVGLLGYAAAVTGRVVVGSRVGSRVWPDALRPPGIGRGARLAHGTVAARAPPRRADRARPHGSAR